MRTATPLMVPPTMAPVWSRDFGSLSEGADVGVEVMRLLVGEVSDDVSLDLLEEDELEVVVDLVLEVRLELWLLVLLLELWLVMLLALLDTSVFEV